VVSPQRMLVKVGLVVDAALDSVEAERGRHRGAVVDPQREYVLDAGALRPFRQQWERVR
jgi:hypothetical protein